jgi:hypothetical protein
MKKVITNIMLMLMLVMVSCQQDDEQLGKGYLELGSVGVEGVTIESVSRAEDETFVVDILCGETLVSTFEVNKSSKRIILDIGKYTIRIYSHSYGATYNDRTADDELYFGEPQYYIEDEFEIEENKGVYRSYSLPMINSLVKFEMFDNYEEIFPTANLTIDNRTLAPGDSAYVDAGERQYSINVVNTADEANSDTKTITLTAGKAYTITFGLPR